jgi:predicted alpha/beta-hydrolase family hydrolase
MISKIENKVGNPIAQIIFAHGAGADMSHEFMEQVSALLNRGNINVLRFNFPFMDKRVELGKRYPPDRMPKLIDCYKCVINELLLKEVNQTKIPLYLGGKSMGSRVAVTIAADDDIAEVIQGVFCISYPFHPSKKPEKLRLEPLQNTKKPVLILQGDRDRLGSQAEVESYNISDLCHTIFLPDGDHSLKPRVKSGFTQQQHIETAVSNIVQFITKESTHD